MKLKKFFAGVLAAAMMLTVVATAAFADTLTTGSDAMLVPDATTGEANLTLTKTVHVEKGTAPDDMTFEFEVKDSTDKLVANPSVAFDASVDGKEVGSNKVYSNGDYTRTFNIDVAALTANKEVGIYTFTVSEKAYGYQSMTPTRTAPLTLVVTKVNMTGAIGEGYGYYVALHTDANATADNKISAADAFENVYNNVRNLKLRKTVHGSFANLNTEFQFKVKFFAKNDVDNSNYKGPQVTELNGTISDNVVVNSYLQLDKVYTVTLKHNGSVKFDNLPNGIQYEIYEDTSAYNAEASAVKLNKENVDYTVTVAGVQFNENSEKVTSSVTVDVDAAFTNTNQASPDMGVVLDNAPYIAMLAIVAIGGVALMLNKRRRDEE